MADAPAPPGAPASAAAPASATAPFPDTGRRVLVSGASRGLGRAVAAAFAERGDQVAVHYGTRRADAEATLASLAGAGHALIGADLSTSDGAQELMRETVTALGGIDVLVNNAAVNTPHPPAHTSYEEWTAAWQAHVAVNLFGTANLSHLAARHMIDQGAGGRIVNIGSRGAFRGEPDHPAYGATKAAVHALGQSLAVALAPYGIAVSSVAPGFIDTDRVAHRLTGAQGEAIRAQSPFGRVATPEEIAAAVLWLASPEAQWSSGTVLDLNGASYLRT
ncbi:SDR family NAD(P)-dependent oxidoreductase [Streptomyces zagrosensis]|uniref:NAD(P)-dependent dehydrogenase (Short-subunit alcohol dehydrogenase family) n=1 Tax=Streptomyces zagrosensis TaxID=1042984 RepID=A0A7W9UX17_9ACTN|nr:SDR family oxidoreductase [Streptomyces zagrosensis]MBB5933254.1 NAD(P)-dependent dehydrogenase (short-subunit alcohol dehydrogenase family) [Streptomyces zagrosensis]